jgi:hypothetical protein
VVETKMFAAAVAPIASFTAFAKVPAVADVSPSCGNFILTIFVVVINGHFKVFCVFRGITQGYAKPFSRVHFKKSPEM